MVEFVRDVIVVVAVVVTVIAIAVHPATEPEPARAGSTLDRGMKLDAMQGVRPAASARSD